MNLGPLKVAAVLAVVLVSTTSTLRAQDTTLTLSGTVTDSAGKPISNARVLAKNTETGQFTEAQTDASGAYTLSNLAPGTYEIAASGEGFGTSTVHVVLPAGTSTNFILTQGQSSPPGAPQSDNLPNAPSSTKTEPSLSDLGFSPAESRANAKEQALLDKRTHMLKIHQRMGLITTIPMIASVVTSFNASGKSTSSTSRDLHVALGAVTGDLYGITAYYAIRAPRVPGTETRGPIRLHKALAWVHGTGMIMTPILGAMAFSQKNNGEKVHGIAQAHGPVAIITAGAYGAALLSVSMKF